MRIQANVSLAYITPTVTVEHLGQELSFSISYYRRTIFSGEYDVFGQINAYWEDQTDQVAQEIFDIYKRIYQAFEDLHDKEAMRSYLQEQVKQLLSFHDLTKVQEWIAFRASDIRLPASIPQEFVADIDKNTSIGKTYIAADYRKLTALSMVLRSMIPIWGEYLFSIKTEIDDRFKEMHAFQLIDKVLVPDLPVITKLMDYIDKTIAGAQQKDSTGVLNGISSSDTPRWLLSLISIKCLATGDIRGSNQDAHLVTFIHMFIQSRMNSKDDGGDRIKPKELDETMDENTARASALERYKVKANISTGDIVELEFYLQDPERVAPLLAGLDDKGQPINMQDVYAAIDRVKKEYEGIPTKPQTDLLAWVFSPIVSPRSVLYLPEYLVKQMMGVCEAVLWHRRHYYLSVLSTCHPLKSEKEMVVSPVDAKMRIPEELSAELHKHFPYTRNQRNKKLVNAAASNLAMENIDIMTNNFMRFGWRPTSEAYRIEQALGYRTNRFPVKPDIKTDFTRLVIELQTLSYLSPAVLAAA